MRTTVPAVEDAIQARLAAALTGTLVRFGLPPDVPTQKDRVYLIGVENLSRASVMQQGPVRETYTIPLVLEVERAGTNRSTARARAWELIGLIADDLADTPHVAGAADRVEFAGVPEMNLIPTQDGWIARALVHIAATAVIV